MQVAWLCRGLNLDVELSRGSQFLVPWEWRRGSSQRYEFASAAIIGVELNRIAAINMRRQCRRRDDDVIVCGLMLVLQTNNNVKVREKRRERQGGQGDRKKHLYHTSHPLHKRSQCLSNCHLTRQHSWAGFQAGLPIMHNNLFNSS